jgi:hypothetical protein
MFFHYLEKRRWCSELRYEGYGPYSPTHAVVAHEVEVQQHQHPLPQIGDEAIDPKTLGILCFFALTSWIHILQIIQVLYLMSDSGYFPLLEGEEGVEAKGLFTFAYEAFICQNSIRAKKNLV